LCGLVAFSDRRPRSPPFGRESAHSLFMSPTAVAAGKNDDSIASDDLRLRRSLATRRATMLDVVLSAPFALLYVCGVETSTTTPFIAVAALSPSARAAPRL
jgi:hypothetical protein